jgi:hypothetical protein
MADEHELTQPTQPKTPGVEPVEIPVPTRDAFLRDLWKVAPPVKPKPGPDEPAGDTEDA